LLTFWRSLLSQRVKLLKTDNMIGEKRTSELMRKFSNCPADLKDSIMDYADKMVGLGERHKR
jgi:hypothetical protein